MEYTLKLSDQHMQVLNAALVEMPFRVASPVIQEINRQIQASKETDTKTSEKTEAST